MRRHQAFALAPIVGDRWWLVGGGRSWAVGVQARGVLQVLEGVSATSEDCPTARYCITYIPTQGNTMGTCQ